jgi:hypothetical protein
MKSLFPTLKRREKLPHHVLVLVLRYGLGHILVDLVDELRAELYHLVHGAIISEGTILVAIHTVILVFASVGIGAENLLGERHSAALTKF